MGRQLGLWGGAFTVIYLVGLAWISWDRLPCLHTMPLNELGDFLAGAFGPLAILWLVLGFFQQGIELRQNSEALHLQATELKNSVQQQTEMVSTAKAQFDLDKVALERSMQDKKDQDILQKKLISPRIVISGIHLCIHAMGKDCWSYKIEIMNTGHECWDLKLSSTLDETQDFARLGDSDVLQFYLKAIQEFPSAAQYAKLSYRTIDHEQHEIDYVIQYNNKLLSFFEFSSQ